MDNKGIHLTCQHVINGRYRLSENESPCGAVVNAVAQAADSDPLDLPPLYEFMDVEVIEKVLNDRDRLSNAETVIKFDYMKWRVFLRGDGEIQVCDTSKPTDPKPVIKDK